MDLNLDLDLSAMQRACATTERVVEGVRAEQYGLPTPCSEWDVRSLLNHVLGTLVLGEALLADRPPEVAMGPGTLPERDLVGDDPVKAYRTLAEALLATASTGTLERDHDTPLGTMPGPVLGGFTTLDIVVHGWDLAAATGQDAGIDPDLAGAVLDFARQGLIDGLRGSRIGPEVPVPPDAPVVDRLVAYLGRRP
jgi:uncharacterized protein (TIGR03086 family)